LTDEEFNKLYTAADQRTKCIIDIAYLTALRINDILDIRLDDIQNGELNITIKKTGKKICFRLEGDLADAIERAKALDKTVMSMYLFCNRKGTRMNYVNFNKSWLKLQEQVGLRGTNIHFHDIRAKAATDAADMGVDPQKLLGHRHRNMTDKYIKQRQIDKVTPLKKPEASAKY
jgi:integrase